MQTQVKLTLWPTFSVVNFKPLWTLSSKPGVRGLALPLGCPLLPSSHDTGLVTRVSAVEPLCVEEGLAPSHDW